MTKRLIAITGPDAAVKAFTLKMMHMTNWFPLDAGYPVKAAAAAFFGLPLDAFLAAQVDRFSIEWA